MQIVTKEEVVCKESFQQIIKKLFLICKADPNLQRSKDLKEIENRISELVKKEEKNNELVKRSGEIKENLERKLSILEDENETIRIQLLEKLGCEI